MSSFRILFLFFLLSFLLLGYWYSGRPCRDTYHPSDMSPLSHLSTLLLLSSTASAFKLFTTHYAGTVSTLTLSKSTAGNGSYGLEVSSSITACGKMPSWLTYSKEKKKLWCSDESFNLNGTLSSFDVGKDGSLVQTAKITTLGGGVNSVVYGKGEGFLAVAH